MDSDDKFAIAMMIIGCATVLGLTGLLVSCGNEVNTAIEEIDKSIDDTNAAIDASRKTARDVSPEIEHANGCPLDAVAYDAPAFTNRDGKSLKVVDRLSGDSWWLVKIGTEWVVLPIESDEVANVG